MLPFVPATNLGDKEPRMMMKICVDIKIEQTNDNLRFDFIIEHEELWI